MSTFFRPLTGVLFLLLSLYGFTQEFSISGKVVDAKNAIIEFANIVVLTETEEAFIKGTSTDDKGLFLIEGISKGNYLIRVSFIGFKDFEQKITLTETLDLKTIQLTTSLENLDEVTITAKRPTITRKPDRLIFNVENTALLEGTTLNVLKSTPGIIVSEGGINIKSASATVYINNRKVQLTSDELIQLLESAPANTIKSVEVITNPPASYDADSGSVINIVMSKNLATGYRGSIFNNYTQGVFPRYNVGASQYFKNNKINLNLNYSYTNKKINRAGDHSINYLNNLNEIDEIWRSDENRNTWSETHNINLNFDYYIDSKNTLSINSTALYMPYFKYQIKNTTNIFDANQSFLRNFTSDNLSRDNKYNVGTDLIFKHNFKNDASLTLNTHYTTYDFERNQNVFQDESLSQNDDSEFETLANQNTDIITAKLDYNLPIDDTSTFDVGIKYSNVNTDSDITRTDIVNGQAVLNPNNSDAFKYNENVFAAFTNYNKSWDKWELNLGLRVEQTNIEGESLSLSETNTQDYLNWFPNASVSYQISGKAIVYTNYKRSISRPSYTDLNPFTFFINENTIVLGNPNLIPVYRDYYNVGINFLEHFTIEAYYINYDGDIVELPRQNNQTNIIAFTPVNLDTKVDYGFDFAFEYSPTDRWFLYAVTSFYNISEETNFGEGFVALDQWSNYSILQNSWSLLKDRSLNVNLTLTWVGKNLQQFQTVEDRLVSELSISKSIFNRKGVISLAVDDIFNLQDFESSIGYLNQSSTRFYDMDNRFIKLGFRYKFGNTKLSTNERFSEIEERDRIKDLN